MKKPRPPPRVTRSVAAKNRNMANTFACHLAAFLEDKDMDKLAEEGERFMGYLISRDFVRHTLQKFVLRFLLFLLKHEYGKFYESVVKDFLLELQDGMYWLADCNVLTEVFVTAVNAISLNARQTVLRADRFQQFSVAPPDYGCQCKGNAQYCPMFQHEHFNKTCWSS